MHYNSFARAYAGDIWSRREENVAVCLIAAAAAALPLSVAFLRPSRHTSGVTGIDWCGRELWLLTKTGFCFCSS